MEKKKEAVCFTIVSGRIAFCYNAVMMVVFLRMAAYVLMAVLVTVPALAKKR